MPVTNLAAHQRFGEHIRKMRRIRGLTQRDLGRRCGTSGDTIRRIERSEISPTLDTILKVANGLELLPSTLFESLELASTAGPRELADMLHGRSDTEVRLVIALVRQLLHGLDALLPELTCNATTAGECDFDDGCFPEHRCRRPDDEDD